MTYTMQTPFIAARMRDRFQSSAYDRLPAITIHECRHPGAGQTFIAERDGEVLDFGQRLSSTLALLDRLPA